MTATIRFEDTSERTSEVLARTLDNIRTEKITLRDLLAIMGEQGLLLLCALLSLPFLFPVSIPGVSTVFGAGIILIAVAVTINRLPWLPAFLANRELDTKKLVPVLQRGVAFMRRIDRYLRPRLPFLTTGAVMNRVNGLGIMFAGILLMLPLGFIPFSNTLPGVAILLLSNGILQRDGLLVALGYVMIGLTLIYFAGLAWLAWSAGQAISIPGFG